MSTALLATPRADAIGDAYVAPPRADAIGDAYVAPPRADAIGDAYVALLNIHLMCFSFHHLNA